MFNNQVPTPGSNYVAANSPASFQNYIYSPSTPGAFYAPQTPGANAYSNYIIYFILNLYFFLIDKTFCFSCCVDFDHSDWHMDGLMVRIKDSYHLDPDLCGVTGVIRSIHVRRNNTLVLS